MSAEALTLNRTGVGGNGALRNATDNNSWAGPITLGSASPIYGNAGTLRINGNVAGYGYGLTVDGAGWIGVNAKRNGHFER